MKFQVDTSRLKYFLRYALNKNVGWTKTISISPIAFLAEIINIATKKKYMFSIIFNLKSYYHGHSFTTLLEGTTTALLGLILLVRKKASVWQGKSNQICFYRQSPSPTLLAGCCDFLNKARGMSSSQCGKFGLCFNFLTALLGFNPESPCFSQGDT
jgi:hypothetical protein